MFNHFCPQMHTFDPNVEQGDQSEWLCCSTFTKRRVKTIALEPFHRPSMAVLFTIQGKCAGLGPNLCMFQVNYQVVTERRMACLALSAARQAIRVRRKCPARYAAGGGPNQVVSASRSPRWVRSPTQATYPSGRINTAVGAVIAPSTGSSHLPPYSASIT